MSKNLDLSSHFTSSSFQTCSLKQIPQISYLQNKVIQISCEDDIKETKCLSQELEYERYSLKAGTITAVANAL